jgi:class 3 adenylate cyclase
VGLEQVRRDRAVLPIERDGEPIAAVLHDAAIGSDRELMSVVAETVRYTAEVAELRQELVARGGDAAQLPSGNVTFLFGDLERSTEALERLGDAFTDVLTKVRDQMRRAASDNRGHIVDIRADDCFLVFAEPPDALTAAVQLERGLAATAWPGDVAIRLRVGLHSGRPVLTRSGYVGLDIHRAARVMATARGGQIVASEAVAEAVADRLPEGVSLDRLGSFKLRGLADEDVLYEVVYAPA